MSVVQPGPQPRAENKPVLTEQTIYRLLVEIGMRLDISIDRSSILIDADQVAGQIDSWHFLTASAERAGILLREAVGIEVDDAMAFIREGYPLIVARENGHVTLVHDVGSRQVEAVELAAKAYSRIMSRKDLQQLLSSDAPARIFIAKKQFDLDSISASPFHPAEESHGHPTPLRRFFGLLRLEMVDIATVILFAFVGGTLTLATPLAVESLVNVVSWGTYIQPLIVLGIILLMCLGIAGILRILQKFLVELIQRRQFVRIVSDLAHRFPRANRRALAEEYPREVANRVFDIMTIQKATAVLLLDGLSIVLTTILGMVLLAFYHPFLLGFDLVLLISMITITWGLGRGGVRTAIDESATKYGVAHWLQDVIASPSIFKSGGGEALAIQRANQLTASYIRARKRQFGVVIRQSAFAILLQVIASTALLALGGWLVMDGQLTLGQLVASELVVTVVVGAFAKAGKSLEKFYDLMAGVEKVGHMIDIPTDPLSDVEPRSSQPIPVRWSDVLFQRAASRSQVPAGSVKAGSTVALIGNDVDGCSDLARSFAGLCKPSSGIAQVADFDSSLVAGGSGTLVGFAGDLDVFHGTVRENIDLGRSGIGVVRIRETLTQVGLSQSILRLDDGLDTTLQTAGQPLSTCQIIQLVIARAIAPKPSVLVIDGLLDRLGADVRQHIWNTLAADDAPWTLVVVTAREDVAAMCDQQITVHTRH